MANIRFYNIDWSQINDTSKLPSQVTIQIPEAELDNEDVESELSALLLNEFGCEHNGFDYEII